MTYKALDANDGWLRHVLLAIALLIGALIAGNGGAPLFEESMRNARDGLRIAPASGQIIVAEIDARSLREFQNWPWPRHLHADLLDRLDAAGVTSVSFDVDFSSPSSPQDDAIFAAALARFGGTVVLPTFQQAAGAGLDEHLENLPIKSLQEHAFLGSVNVRTDEDGVMRYYNYGNVTGNTARPSIGALMAGKPGTVGGDFRIDGAIDPATIPRVSVADIIKGRVAADQLRGKAIIVGATAIEMGDRYATPRYGVIPGVVIQALGAETLVQDRINRSLGPWLGLLAVLIVGVAINWRRTQSASTGIVVAALAGLQLIAFALEAGFVGSPAIVPALSACLAFWVGIVLISFNARIRRSRLFDEATGLMNGRALEKELSTKSAAGAMVVSFRNFQETLSVLNANERALVTEKLIERLRLTDFDSPLYALQPGIIGWVIPTAELDDMIQRADALCAIFISPISLGARAILLTPAFGIAERHTLSAADVLAAATLRASDAQAAGQRWAVHTEAAADAVDRAVRLLADLETGLADEQIWIAYQPKWSIGQQRISGAEALVRWRHPVFGPIPPDEFIPLLEREGRLHQLTVKVVVQALADLQNWRGAGHDPGVAVNISAPLLADGHFVDELLALVAKADLPPASLTIEVTESATINDSTQVIKALEALQAAGMLVSIDDYGTGQSTLTYLKSFPANEIKIDKSFVSRLADSVGDQVLVRSTIAMAHDLGFKVVAEGVEDAACLAMLATYGCDIAQGWHIGKPLPVAEFVALVEATPEMEKRAA